MAEFVEFEGFAGRIVRRGVNAAGNPYDVFECGNGQERRRTYNPRTRSLRYELPDGSWAYENDLGSNYIRTWDGHERWTDPSGQRTYTINMGNSGKVQFQCTCALDDGGAVVHDCGLDRDVAFRLDHPYAPPEIGGLQPGVQSATGSPQSHRQSTALPPQRHVPDPPQLVRCDIHYPMLCEANCETKRARPPLRLQVVRCEVHYPLPCGNDCEIDRVREVHRTGCRRDFSLHFDPRRDVVSPEALGLFTQPCPPSGPVILRAGYCRLPCGDTCNVEVVREVHPAGCNPGKRRKKMDFRDFADEDYILYNYDICGQIVGVAERLGYESDVDDSLGSDQNEAPASLGPDVARTEEPKEAESSAARRSKRMTVDPELARARRASLRPRARKT